ncbi:oxidoreductase [Tropicimonas sp. S265A]|uniref:oxidoreductase n=1 Tax=Tropicimonas sp. S265A TaxID=3415134 RepID=UPI003C7D9AFB
MHIDRLFLPFTLPNGTTLRNRIVKSAMSDSLGDGVGNPTEVQMRLYERWAKGGVGAAIVGEVQGDPRYPEKPGNLLLTDGSDHPAFRHLARRGAVTGSHLWLQLGHAGALTPQAIGPAAGPSALDVPGLKTRALTRAEIQALPDQIAGTARLAEQLGFSGVQVHAAHGFLLSQFLSPLFNRRDDPYGGPIANRMRLLLEVVAAARSAVSPTFTVALKLNASDLLDGGFSPDDALAVVRDLNGSGLDLIDISGGTYFPGAPAASDRQTSGPYFLDFARAARRVTDIPLMATGGFKKQAEADTALAEGNIDLVGLARALVLAPDLPKRWSAKQNDVVFPRFEETTPGGVTAWYTMRLTAIGEDREDRYHLGLAEALAAYDARDAQRAPLWRSAHL